MASANTHVDTQFGPRLRALRLSVGLSQRELETDGVSYAYISRIEAGMRTPSLSAIVALAGRLRAHASETLAQLGDVDADSATDREYVAALRECERVTALYLLTGSHDGPCLICGGHEHTGGMNGRNGTDTH